MARSEFRPMDEMPEEFMMSQVFGIEITQEQLDASRRNQTQGKKKIQAIPEPLWEKEWSEGEAIIFERKDK